jgi:predicted transglutaminase-like cysteine proteinase
VSKFSRARWTSALSAIVFCLGFCLGLLSGTGRSQAGEPDAASYDPYQLRGFALASADPFEALPSGPQSSEPFGAVLSAPVTGGLQNKWSMVKKKLPGQHRTLVQCRASATGCPPAAKRFLAVLDRALAREGWARIAEINRAINLNIKPMDDMTQYGVVDLWATPLMTFSSSAGDCEDYAIAKYLALQEIGIAEDDLRLIVVHDRDTKLDHAVAAVRYDGSWLILDNRTLEMRPDVDIAGFEPLFVIDRDGVKRMTGTAPKPANLMVSASPAAADLPSSSGWQTTPLLL